MKTIEQPTDNEERIWVPYDELRTYLASLSKSLKQMSSSIEESLSMIEDNAKVIKQTKENTNG